MHVLPIALPATLLGQISHATAELKNYLDAAIPSELRNTMRTATFDLWGTFRFDKMAEFREFKLSIDGTPEVSFPITYDGETFSKAYDGVKRQVIAEWLDMAVQRRMEWGRELADASDDALDNRPFCNLVQNNIYVHDHVDLQEAFLFRLRNAEREARKTSTSSHAKIDAVQRSRPLLQLLDNEMKHAEEWARTANPRDAKLSNWNAGNIPDELHLVYAYRSYHMERRQGFPLGPL